MRRPIVARLRLSGTLVATSALHVGTGSEERGVDLGLARNGAGELYVPGTSLAGALRAWSRSPRADELWGGQSEAEDGGQASRMVVDDAPVSLPPGVRYEEVRDGVGIDRRTGAAAHGYKYERMVLPSATTIALEVTCDADATLEEPALALLQQLRAGLRAGDVRLGAGRSRGMGAVRLAHGETLTVDPIGRRDSMLRSLRRRVGVADPLPCLPLDSPATPDGSRMRFTVHWRPAGPVMVRAGVEGLAVDALPLTTTVEGGQALVLPGSSIKGALRAHAERIVRTVRGAPVAAGDLGEQVRVGDLIEWLFGWSPAGGRPAPDVRKGLACLWVEDCLAERTIPAETWRAVTGARWISDADRTAGDGAAAERPLREVLNRAGLHAWDPVTHVALDRWTGGAADGRLFSVLEPRDVRWGPLVLELDVARLDPELRDPALALVLLVLDDLARGELPLGFATNRGMGDVEVTGMEVQAPEELGWLTRHEPITPDAGVLAAYQPDDLATLAAAWQRWIEGEAAVQ